MKDKIAEILFKELSYIYCHNCHSSELTDDDDNYGCDECYRKQMGWSISMGKSNSVADKILKEIKCVK